MKYIKKLIKCLFLYCYKQNFHYLMIYWNSNRWLFSKCTFQINQKINRAPHWGQRVCQARALWRAVSQEFKTDHRSKKKYEKQADVMERKSTLAQTIPHWNSFWLFKKQVSAWAHKASITLECYCPYPLNTYRLFLKIS